MVANSIFDAVHLRAACSLARLRWLPSAAQAEHGEVRELFARLDSATGERRRELFQQLLSELVRHEVAEEEILRPVSRRDAGEAIANARIKEESQAEELLKEMEKLDPGSAEFTAKLAVTGGTGRFQNARGQATVQLLPGKGNRARVTLSLLP